MKIVGIDPGYERLGLAIIEHSTKNHDELIYSTCLTTPKTISFPERLGLLALKIEPLLAEHRPEILAIEELFFSGNQKTAMKVSEVRGMIIYLAIKAGMKIINLTPLQIKMSTTGYGRASKSQVITMIEKFIRVPKGSRHDDEYDAIAIALTGAANSRQPFIHTLAKL